LLISINSILSCDNSRFIYTFHRIYFIINETALQILF